MHSIPLIALLLLPSAAPFSTHAPRSLPSRSPPLRKPQCPQQHAARRCGSPEMFGPGGGGGFLNLGTPEVVVIGAVAWALLGPKELYRLARQAGEFLGEWQQLGAQARDTFKDAMESEMRADEMNGKAGEAAEASPFAKFTPSALKENVAPLGVPSLADYQANRKASEGDSLSDLGEGEWLGDLGRNVSAAEKEELYRQAVAEMGDPVTNQKNFAEQMSGKRNVR